MLRLGAEMLRLDRVICVPDVGLDFVERPSVLGFGRIGWSLLLGSFRKNHVIGEDSVAFLRLAEVCWGVGFWDAVVSPP